MPTNYDGTPSILDRVIGAQLVVTGTIGRLLRVESREGGERPRVYGVFDVKVDDVLMGDPPSGDLRLRVLGEGRDERAVWIVPVKAGARFLLILARDSGPNDAEDRYAPCFSGAYVLTDENFVNPPKEAIDELTRKIAGFDGTRMSLDGVRRLIRFVLQQSKDRQQQMDAMGLAWLRDRPYPVNEETQERAEAGARSAD